MKLSRRIVSLLMALVMLFTMVSPVFAATLANPYTIEVTASCSNIHLDGVAQNTSGLRYQVYDDETTLAAILGGSGAAVSSITADNIHKKADGTARQIVGWRILHRGPNGHEENDPNIYTTADILAMTVAAKKGDIPAGLENYIQFQAVWEDSEYLYHSNVDFSPFYGTIQWNSAHGYGFFTGTNRSSTGGRHCEGNAATTNLNTDTSNYDGDVFGAFEGWVKVEYEFDLNNGMEKVDIEVSKAPDGTPIVYSFDDILDDPNDASDPYHIASKKNVMYFAKWKNIPLSEYANYGVSTEGDESIRSFVQVDMYGGTADVSDYNRPTQNDDPTLYAGQGLIRAQLPHGSAFAVRYGYVHNFQKTNDSFDGFYRYDPVKDSNGDYVLDENNKVVYNIYTEPNAQGDPEPVLYHEDVVNFGEAPEEDRIYVAKWANIGADVYMDYHPIQEGTGIPGHPEVFNVGFHIQGGVADIAMGSDPVRTTNYDETVEISVDKGNKISDQHGSSFITKVTRTEGDGKTPIQGVTFDGWVVYIRDSSGNFGFAPNADGDPLIITSDIHDYQPEEDVFFLPKWSDIAITDNFYTDFNPGTPSVEPQQRKVTIDLGNASSVTIGIQGPPGSITLDAEKSTHLDTSAAKTLTEMGYTSLSAALDTTDYNRFGGWRIEDDNGNTLEIDIPTEDIMNKELPDGDITIKPLFFGPGINVSFTGATLTLTSGDNTDTPKDGFGYDSPYTAADASLKADGFDKVSKPVFYTAEAGEFLGWVIETMKPGSGEWIPVSDELFDSSEIVDFVFPKDVEYVNIVAKWENDTEQLFATVMMDVLDGTATFEYDDNLAGGRTESGRIVDRGHIYGGKTLGAELANCYPINHAHDTHGDFLGWVKAAHNADGVFVLDETTYETPIDDDDVKDSVPAPGTVVLYIARWENLDLDAYKACVDSYNQGDGGEEGPQLPQIGGEEGYDIEIGEWTMETTLTIVKDGETFTDSISSFPIGRVQEGDKLSELGLTDITDAKFIYDENREFLGWRIVADYDGGQKDCFPGTVFSSDALLEIQFPECNGNRFMIYPVWADLDEIYFAHFDFDGYGGDMERADGTRDGWDGWSVPRNRDLTEEVPEHVLPKNPLKDGDEFLGWRRVLYTYEFDEDGKIAGYIYDTSDETLYTDIEDLYDVDLSAPYNEVVYVAVWKNLLAENPDAYKNYPEGNPGGNPGGGDSGSNIAGGFILLAGDGNLQFSADDDQEHIVVNYSGYEAATLMLEEGMSINETLAAEDMENFIYNLYRKDYNFTGWDVYTFNDAEVLRVPRTTPLPENMENYIPDPYVHPVKTDIVVHEGWAVNGESDDFLDENYPVGTEFDVYSVIHEEDYELVAAGFATEEIFEADNLDEFYICVAQWEKAPETKVEVELPNIDLEADEVPVVQVQTDIQLPEIPSDANDPESEPLFESIEQVKEALDEVIAEVIDRDVDGKDKTVFMEISLMIKDETTGETTPVDPEHFPDEGLDVYIPFPKGTGKSGFKFVIAHLKSTDGSIEIFEEGDYEITDKGIKIHVTSLSPFAVGYEEITSGGQGDVTVTPGESAPGRQNPNTGVHF